MANYWTSYILTRWLGINEGMNPIYINVGFLYMFLYNCKPLTRQIENDYDVCQILIGTKVVYLGIQVKKGGVLSSSSFNKYLCLDLREPKVFPSFTWA